MTVINVLLTYENLNAEDLRGSTPADYLIAIEADFRMFDEMIVVYEEPYFPVVELARSLSLWVAGEGEGEFVFESMSFEEPGAVVIVREQNGWTFGSRLTPEVTSAVVGWGPIQEGVAQFVTRIRADLVQLGIEPKAVFDT